MKTLYPLCVLGQLFKEKRLASWLPGFPEAGKNLQAPQGAPAQAPVQAQTAPGAPAETPVQMKDRIVKTVERLKEKMGIVTGNPDKYTQGLVEATKVIVAQIAAIETKLNSPEVATAITTLTEDKARETLKKFEDNLTKIETESEADIKQSFGGKGFPEALAENEEAKTLITEQRKA
ncbi:MAG: hypothetical protein AAB540_03705, partial [Patescibacteria group bacterium]